MGTPAAGAAVPAQKVFAVEGRILCAVSCGAPDKMLCASCGKAKRFAPKARKAALEILRHPGKTAQRAIGTSICRTGQNKKTKARGTRPRAFSFAAFPCGLFTLTCRLRLHFHFIPDKRRLCMADYSSLNASCGALFSFAAASSLTSVEPSTSTAPMMVQIPIASRKKTADSKTAMTGSR